MVDVERELSQTEVLLTGGSGFLGKVVLGLLLDRYPVVRRVHLLLRPRRGRTARERFEAEALGSPALRQLAARWGDAFVADKIRVWEGEASAPGCGLADETIANELSGVGLILHCAGLVEFFPPVEQSLAANVDATSNVAALAKRLRAGLTHVSTCYVAGRRDGLVEESEPIVGFSPHRQDPNDVSFDAAAELELLRTRIAEIRSQGNAVAERLTELGRSRAERWGWVNTYTYTKSLAEQSLAADSELRATIVRPAIVESALEFPFPGWIEGGRTAAPLVLMALGGMRNWPARPDLSLEVVPVDQVAAATIAAGALLLAGRAAQVYQLASSDQNPYPLEELLPLLANEARRRGSARRGGPRLLSASAYRRRNQASRRRAERLEGGLKRASAALRRRKLPGAAGLEAKARAARLGAVQTAFREQTIEQYLPFLLDNRYVFEAQNIREGRGLLAAADRERLPWSPESVDWPSYWRRNQIEGVLRWVQPEAARQWTFQL